MTSSAPDDRTSAEDAVAAGADADETQSVLQELATSSALLPQAPSADDEEQPEGTVALPVIEQEGQKYIPVFTSEEALEEAGADVSTAIRVPLAELAANWPSEDMWLAVNPASEDGIGLPPDVVRMLPVFAGGLSGADGEA
ncbi:SseB family protein [Saccharopolyspora erythraea]|uniref:SseB family protein n=1 Tax=Saccharopolyspora erythraea TaxID=1836 RepID=UPI001BA9C3B6|nr:SseB family protein [Saccharopolyspora erythraea]QUH02239.1 SseB family protein [Saccharopolyspora erythraea]